MFTRVVEITTKTGKSHELANTIHEKVLPILGMRGRQSGEEFHPCFSPSSVACGYVRDLECHETRQCCLAVCCNDHSAGDVRETRLRRQRAPRPLTASFSGPAWTREGAGPRQDDTLQI